MYAIDTNISSCKEYMKHILSKSMEIHRFPRMQIRVLDVGPGRWPDVRPIGLELLAQRDEGHAPRDHATFRSQ